MKDSATATCGCSSPDDRLWTWSIRCDRRNERECFLRPHRIRRDPCDERDILPRGEARDQAVEREDEAGMVAATGGRRCLVRAAVDEVAVRAVIGAKVETPAETLDDVVARRVDFLTAYQDAAYAESYIQSKRTS